MWVEMKINLQLRGFRMWRRMKLAAVALFLGAMTAGSANAGNIFDDDWVPGKPGEARPTTAPATQPLPKVAKPPMPPIGPPPLIPPLSEKPRIADAGRLIAKPVGTARRAVPPKEDLDRSRALLKEAFAVQLADRALPARRKLAESLLNEARKAGENQSDQFALFGGAINAAKESASLRLVIAVADEMAKKYTVDPQQVKLGIALSMPLKADSPLNTADNVLAGLELLDTLIATDEMAAAARLCASLRPAAVGDSGLIAILQRRQQEIDLMRTAHDRIALHIEKLKTAPDDTAANSAVGAYQCYYIGNWPRGLAMLARGSDAELKKLAVDELAIPTSADSLIKLGDGWWNVAAKQALTVQPKIHQHAAGLYAQCSGNFSPLLRIKIEKRIDEAAANNAANTEVANGLREAIARQKIGKLTVFVERFPGKPGAPHTPLAESEPLEGDVDWAPVANGYSVVKEVSIGHNAGNHGNKIRDRVGKVIGEPGFHLEGGSVLISKGTLDLRGEPENPVIFKNVHIGCELTGEVKASFVVFDHCTFTAEGPYRWTGAPSAKFEYTNCLLIQSTFPHFSWDDDGIKLNHCTFAACKFPEREAKPGKTDDSYKRARYEWSRISDCEFLDCELSASVFWLPQKCNFFNCKAVETAIYSSPTELAVELGLPPDDRDRMLNDLKGRFTFTGEGRVVFTAARGFYQTEAYPKP